MLIRIVVIQKLIASLISEFMIAMRKIIPKWVAIHLQYAKIIFVSQKINMSVVKRPILSCPL